MFVTADIENLILESHKAIMSEEYQRNLDHCPPNERQRQFKTIKISLPRSLGTTLAALNVLDLTRSLLITPNAHICQHTKRQAQSINFTDKFKQENCITTMDTIDRNFAVVYSAHCQYYKTNRLKYELVVFDPTSIILNDKYNSQQFNSIVSMLDNYTECFVLLG